MEKIQFQTNVPVDVVLKFAEGKEVPSNFGGPQIMYTTDRGLMFLPPIVGDKIKALKPQAGNLFTICKAEQSAGGGRKRIIWEVKKAGADDFPGDDPIESSAPAGATNTSQGNGFNNHQTSQPQNQPTTSTAPGELAVPRVMPQGFKPNAAPVKMQYGAALRTFLIEAVEAAHGAEAYAAANNYSVRFTSEDLQGMASTLFIQAAREGWLTWDGGTR